MKKVLIILQFGKPHSWTQKFIDHVQHLQKYGWYFQIYTPNNFLSRGNVQIIPMTIDEYNSLVEKKLGVNPKVFITQWGFPSMHMTDHLIFLGAIFEDYLKDADFWGTMGIDCVVGRLDHFVPDSELENCEVYTDDIGQFNANFCLWKNEGEITHLFNKIPGWTAVFEQEPCPGCLHKGEHKLMVTDEIAMSKLLEFLGERGLKYKHPKYYLFHSHDRLENHRPTPKLVIKEDGSLWELLNDVEAGFGRRHPVFGREIGYFHFSGIKQWPI